MSKIVGFLGIEAADILIYTARILYHAGLRVLICDYSPADELKYFIPLGDELDTQRACIDYRGIDFTRETLKGGHQKEYDIILINFGFLKESEDVSLCGFLIYVTDKNRAHIKKLLALKQNIKQQIVSQLIIRDITAEGVRMPSDIKELKKLLAPKACYKINLNRNDCKILYQMQYGGRFPFVNISNGLYHCLYGIMEDCFGEVSVKKDFRRTVRNAMKGK